MVLGNESMGFDEERGGHSHKMRRLEEEKALNIELVRRTLKRNLKTDEGRIMMMMV